MSVSLVNYNYLILLALAAEPMHGLKIQKQIVGDTAGMYVMPNTIYASLNIMTKAGLIVKLEGYPVGYMLSDKGRRLLEIESRSLKLALEQARRRLNL